MKSKTEFKNRLYGQFKQLLAVQVGVLLLCLAAASGKAQTYAVLHNFGSLNGQGSLLVSGTTLFGATWWGGITNQDNPYGCGTVFTMNTDGSGYTVLHNFTGSDGVQPLGLTLSGTTLYGTTDSGGTSNFGTVFKINTDGSGYTVLRSFTGYPSDGADGSGDLLLSGATLYGTTSYGGIYSGGTVFKINTDGSGYEVIQNFTGGNDGYAPGEGLVLSGTTLYGITEYGGTSDEGTIYEVNTDGSDFAVLKSFTWTNNDGYEPEAGLILSDTTLYGATWWGPGSPGFPNFGTVYKVNTDGSGFTVLKDFQGGNDGAHPMGALVASGTKLYGTTWGGGSSSNGIVFAVNTDGTGFMNLYTFTALSPLNYPGGTNGDGANPLVLVLSGTTLYGMTDNGGSFSGGVVFALGYPPTIQTPPQTQTAEMGATVDFKVHIAGSNLSCYQWSFNGSNVITFGTNCVLELTNVQFSQSGAYTVVITNLFGAVTSAPVMLNVIPPVESMLVPGVNLMGQVGNILGLDYSDNLGPAANWETMATITLSNSSQYYFDLTTPLPPQRFYRAWQTGTLGVIPSLNLNFVPAITLTGNVGNSLQLDYINQFGPTNAWVMLDTITLTNTSQLYFDVSALGQPQRLYQIVPQP